MVKENGDILVKLLPQ